MLLASSSGFLSFFLSPHSAGCRHDKRRIGQHAGRVGVRFQPRRIRGPRPWCTGRERRQPANAGAVNVIYGSNTGLSATGNQLWHQDSSWVEGVAEAGDSFGATLVCGDFDVDQFDDLAIGVPGEDVGGAVDAGAVNVLYGSNGGLTAAGNELWHQDSPRHQGVAEAGDRFGAALASGDFNDDVADDLAIGVPGED